MKFELLIDDDFVVNPSFKSIAEAIGEIGFGFKQLLLAMNNYRLEDIKPAELETLISKLLKLQLQIDQVLENIETLR
ncbi:MAG: hypothetical protein AB1743_09590 [Actinomycetota bacterium]